jgi:ABC-type lipoprotein release transport system permease subunit
MEILPEYSRFNRLSIHVTNLDHVSALREDVFRSFGLEIDMAKVEALNNYRMVTKLTATLSAFIIGISVVSVCIFMIYILYVHLYKNRGYLGMLKAFGASPKTLKDIYLHRMLLSLLLSTGLALLAAIVLGYSGALRTLVSLWMPVEPNQIYFNIINLYPVIFIVTLVLLTYWSTNVTADFILRLSPGDLIYDRLETSKGKRQTTVSPVIADKVVIDS